MADLAKIEPYRMRDLLPVKDGGKGVIEVVTPGKVTIAYTIDLLDKLVAVKSGDPRPAVSDLMAFGNCCIETGANPYLKEAWLVYIQGRYTPVISAQYKLRKAHECKGYRGFQQGWITTEGVRHPSGPESTALPDDVIGVWGKFYRADEEDYYHETWLKEFARKSWGNKPLTMLQKVNRDHGIRHKYPELMDGMYTENEIQREPVIPAPECDTPGRGEAKKIDATVSDTKPITDPETLSLMLEGCFNAFADKILSEHNIEIGGGNKLFIQFATFILMCDKSEIENPGDYTFDMLQKLLKALEQPLPEAIVEILPKEKDEK